MNKSWLTAAGAIILVALIAVSVCVLAADDRQAPKIKLSGEEITYVEGQGYSSLLSGVTAYDNKDGDVTASVMVESVVPLKSGEEAVVCYVAKDKSNNIARVDRIVKYVGNGEDFVSSDKNKNEVESGSSGGDLSPAEQESRTVESSESQPQETSSANEESTAYSGVNPVLFLKSKETTIKAGSTFNIVSYVDNITDDVDDRTTLFKRIIADGSYDVNIPGDYTLNVYCTDTDRNASDRQQFILHVVQ